MKKTSEHGGKEKNVYIKELLEKKTGHTDGDVSKGNMRKDLCGERQVV